MAEGFELYHVPQQCRRGKLRLLAQTQHPNTVESSHSIHNQRQGCEGLLLPLYEPSSLVSSDLPTCAAGNGNDHGFQHQSSQLLSHIERFKGSPIKEGGMDLMGFLGSASGAQQNAYLEPHGSIGIIPTSVHDITYNNHQSSYYGSSQNVRQSDQSFNGDGGGGEIMVYRPETLSLSLPSYQNQHIDHSLELNLQRYVVSSVGDLSTSSVPLGPFTGYASILKGSRFSKSARQLLEDSCDVSSRICFAEKVTPDLCMFNPSGDSLNGFEYGDSSANDNNDDGEHKKFKSRLISMLDEVYKRYKQYYQQLEAVIVSFESVAGLSNAAPFVNLALKAMSKQFRRLKKAIIDQLQLICKSTGNLSSKKDGIHQVSESCSRPNFCGQLQIHNSGNHPVWRPQRGLPQRAVSVLRSWLFEHFLHPYPTDTDKVMLAKQTGLTRGQVSNWFINARVRLWKPMVEEIYSLEAGQGEKTSRRQGKEVAAHQPNVPVACASELTSDNVSLSCTKTQDASLKRVRTELPDLPLTTDQQMSLLPYNTLPDHACMGVGAAAGGSSGVSLTLGLHHNTGIGLPEPFPTNLTQRYAFNANSEGCIMGVFDGHTRHLNRDVMGGHLLHDFVG